MTRFGYALLALVLLAAACFVFVADARQRQQMRELRQENRNSQETRW